VSESLTPAQARILAAVQAGPRKYNGRAIKPVERLEALGLVTVDWEMDLTVKGGGAGTVWRITVTAAKGRK
jgi:hypothetical protein